MAKEPTRKRVAELPELIQSTQVACPELTYVGDEVLRQKAEEVSLEEGQRIAEELENTLKNYRKATNRGRGLAAPQIGSAKRVFVTLIDDVYEAYINPKITNESGEQNYYRESCISTPGMRADVARPVSITLEYVDGSGKKQTLEADGLVARVLQHEFDHLEGVVNIDKAVPGSIEYVGDVFPVEELREKADS